MTKYIFIFLIFLSAANVLLASETVNQTFTPDELIVKLKSEVAFNWSELARFKDFVRQIEATSIKRVFPTIDSEIKNELERYYLIRFNRKTVLSSTLDYLKDSPWVENVDFNYLRRQCDKEVEPNDHYFSEQWNLRVARIPEAWKLSNGSTELVIAVIDSGVDLQHNDLKERLWDNPGEIPDNQVDDDGNGYIDDVVGWDFSDAPTLDGTGDYIHRDNEPSDESGHGTHVSGIACAQTNNSIGIAGISWNCKLMPLRGGFNVASGGSFLQDDDVAAAIVYAADNGAKIINMSWGDIANAFVIRDAVNYAYQRGCILVAAAGNSNERKALYPAVLPNVISVGATDKSNRIASISNYGEQVDLFAPGVNILSTMPGNEYSTLSGTSIAAPHVSGVLGLLLSKYPGLTNDDVANILSLSANRIRLNRNSSDSAVIDAAKMLVTCLQLSAKIRVEYSPDEIQFNGTACGHGFEKYSIEYGKISKDSVRWQKLYQSDIPAWNEELYRWKTSLIDEGDYAVRLSVFGTRQRTLREKTVVKIDQSVPKISEVKVNSWLEGNRNHTIISWNTDDEAVCSINYRLSGKDKDFRPLYIPKLSNIHNLNLSKSVGDGSYEFFITARNEVNLTSVDDRDGNYYTAEVKHNRISSDEFTRLPFSGIPQMHLVDTVVDFDNDGLSELVGMEVGTGGYSNVVVYENTSNGYKPVFTSDKYFPWAVGDSDNDGLLEIIGNNYENTFIIESPRRGEYPIRRIFQIQGHWGGQFFDLDVDGKVEIVSKNTNTNSIDIYENAGDNEYSLIASLTNPTEGDNILGASYAISDFDGDGRTELAAGDADGDVFVYSFVDDNQFTAVWQERLEDSINAYDFAVGDIDGDGRDEFIVGCRSSDDEFGFEMWHRNYFAFRANSKNSYQQVFKQQVKTAQSSGNGIVSGDLDSDGIDEILIVVQPHAYVFKKEINGWKGIWYHHAENTFSPAVLDVDNSGTNEMLFNLDDGLGFFGVETNIKLASRPYGLTASLINDDSVFLSWQTDSEPLYYRIYRKTDGEFRLLKDKLEENSFIDSSVKQGVTYWYAVSSIMQDKTETFLSEEVSVEYEKLPKLVSAKQFLPNQVELRFDKNMDESAQNKNNYRLFKLRIENKETGEAENSQSSIEYVPWSTILDRNGKRVILSFDESVFSVNTEYKITVKNLRDVEGMPIDSQFNTVSFVTKDSLSRDLSKIYIYPNPVRICQYGTNRVTFGGVPTETEISVYTVSGDLVEELKVSENDNNKKIWWLSRQNKTISSGVYLCMFELEEQSVIKKLCLVR